MSICDFILSCFILLGTDTRHVLVAFPGAAARFAHVFLREGGVGCHIVSMFLAVFYLRTLWLYCLPLGAHCTSC